MKNIIRKIYLTVGVILAILVCIGLIAAIFALVFILIPEALHSIWNIDPWSSRLVICILGLIIITGLWTFDVNI